jgi:GntR family transcriptional regulator
MKIDENYQNKLNRFSPVPLHQQLSNILFEKINSGEFRPDEKLPSENEFMAAYDISRQVVRQTLNNLRQQGLIYTDHGRGSFVTRKRIEKPLDILQSYHEAMKNSGFQVEVSIIKKELIETTDFIAEQLQTNSKQVFYLERVGILDNKPENILISYISPGTWGFDKLMDFSGGSLTDHLKNVCGVSLIRSSNFIEVTFAHEFESRILNIASKSVLLQISSLNYDTSNMPVEFNHIICPGSSFRFKFDSYIRKKNGK